MIYSERALLFFRTMFSFRYTESSMYSRSTLPHIHPHAFRHTAASIMIANGIDLVTTANELGHANATTTATIYAHQITVAKAKASEVRAGVFSRGIKETG